MMIIYADASLPKLRWRKKKKKRSGPLHVNCPSLPELPKKGQQGDMAWIASPYVGAELADQRRSKNMVGDRDVLDYHLAEKDLADDMRCIDRTVEEDEEEDEDDDEEEEKDDWKEGWFVEAGATPTKKPKKKVRFADQLEMPSTPVPWGRRRRSTLVNSFSTDQLKSPPLLRNSPSHPLMGMPPQPSRIPTPTEVKGRARALRYVQSDKKENAPQKPTRLMGPISPARNQNQPGQGLSKSRTMGVFSSITSSFSRSNLHMSHNGTNRQSSSSFAGSRLDHLSKSRSSVHLRSTAPATTEVSNITAAAAPATSLHSHSHSRSSSATVMFTDEEKEKLVYDAHPTGYWCGRVASLYTLYSNEMLAAVVNDPDNLSKYTAPTPVGFVPPRLSKDKDKEKNKDSQQKKLNDDPLDSERLASSMFLAEASDDRFRRAFATLRGYCVTPEAKKSLWDFQQLFARTERNERFLPAGGHMTDAWYTKLTKGAKDDTKSERGTSLGLGRRTGLSRFGRSRNDLSHPHR